MRMWRALTILREEGIYSLLDKLARYVAPLDRIYWRSCRYRQAEKTRRAWVSFRIYTALGTVYYLLQHGKFVQHRNECWELVDRETGECFAAPTFRELSKGLPTYQDRLANLYEEPGFVTVESGDIVVDIGSYLGVFSTQAADIADTVLAIDPYYVIGYCYETNTDKYDNIRVVPKAMWSDQGEMELNLSHNPSENSLLSVDSRSAGQAVMVDADTVTNVLDEKGFTSVDFLKIEAEGAEPEILEGALDAQPSKIVVQANEERNNDASLPEVLDILNDEPYDVRINNKLMMVYARRND